MFKKKAFFIVFEGVEGCGKSYQSKKLFKNLKVYLQYDGPIEAPIQKGEKIANLIVLEKDEVVKTLPLYASEKITKVNFFKSLITSLNYLIWGDV